MRLLVLLFLILLFGLPVQAQVEYFVEAAVSNPAPFVGQQITYSFRLYSRVSRTNRGAIVDPSFDGFWKREFGTIRQYTESVNGQFYEVKERSFALYPSYAGELVIDSSAFVLEPEPGRTGEVLTTDAITVQVRPLPAQENVVGCDGAVGQLELQPTVDRQTTNLGEPVTMRLVVRGTGNIEQLPAPSVPADDIWRVYANPSSYSVQNIEGVLVGEKVFEWLLTPKISGQQPLPVITMAYFDPDAQIYQSLNTTAINVDVLGTDETPAAAPVSLAAAPLPLKPVPAGLGTPALNLSLFFWLLWIVPPAAFIWLWRRQKDFDERRRNAVRYRRSEALTNAQKMLASAHKAGPEKVYHIIRASMTTYFADKLNADAGTLRDEDIERAMAEHQLDERLQSQVFSCLALVDEGLYAPFETTNVDVLLKNSAKLLAAVDARWQ
jgi:hypothetical protein